jgi:hypothetical protein
MRTLLKMVAVLMLVAVLGGVAWVFLALRFAYSDGERAGYVQKFSRKGWVCKTWEGELALVSLPGTAAEIFPFTVRDPAVAAKIAQTMGHRAVLHYEEHRGLPSSCFGETRHFITDVRAVEQPGGLP